MSDATNDDEDRRPIIEWLESAYSSVGQIMRVAAILDLKMGMVIASYYEIPDRKSGSFTAALTSRLGLRAKIDALRTILRETELLEAHAETLKHLGSLVSWRNLAAHGLAGSTDHDEKIIAFLIAKPGRPVIVEATAEMLSRATDNFDALLHGLDMIENDLAGVSPDWHPSLMRRVTDAELSGLEINRQEVVSADDFFEDEQTDAVADDE